MCVSGVHTIWNKLKGLASCCLQQAVFQALDRQAVLTSAHDDMYALLAGNVVCGSKCAPAGACISAGRCEKVCELRSGCIINFV